MHDVITSTKISKTKATNCHIIHITGFGVNLNVSQGTINEAKRNIS